MGLILQDWQLRLLADPKARKRLAKQARKGRRRMNLKELKHVKQEEEVALAIRKLEEEVNDGD